MNLFSRSVLLAATVAAGAWLAVPCRAQAPAVKTGESIAFLGDSITQQGASSPSGYVRLVVSGLEANGIKVAAVPAGISGHKSNDMLARLDKDVLSKKPVWMTLSCGVNDVWHGVRGVPLDAYKKNITEIVDRAQAAGVKVVILTATLIQEDPNGAFNKTAVEYNEFLRSLAREKNCQLADLNADMRAILAAAPGDPAKRGNLLTVDGVHMNPAGNQMMAAGILRALGLDAAQLEKAKTAWLDIPNACQVAGRLNLTLRQYAQLQEAAAKQNRSVDALLNEELGKAVSALVAPK